MPQSISFPPKMTPAEVVTYIGWMRGLSLADARAATHRVLQSVQLSERSDARIQSLSGGMVRRVALAQALVTDPDVLLLDEPSTGLDPQQRRLMVEVLEQLGGCVLLSSHVMEDVTDLATRVVVLHDGRIQFDGDLDELRFRAPEGTPEHRTAERGFLEVVSSAGDR